jgi:hypothetical protein
MIPCLSRGEIIRERLELFGEGSLNRWFSGLKQSNERQINTHLLFEVNRAAQGEVGRVRPDRDHDLSARKVVSPHQHWRVSLLRTLAE